MAVTEPTPYADYERKWEDPVPRLFAIENLAQRGPVPSEDVLWLLELTNVKHSALQRLAAENERLRDALHQIKFGEWQEVLSDNTLWRGLRSDYALPIIDAAILGLTGGES